MKTGPIIGITTGVIAGTLLLGTGAFAAGTALAEPRAEQRTQAHLDNHQQRSAERGDHDGPRERGGPMAERFDTEADKQGDKPMWMDSKKAQVDKSMWMKSKNGIEWDGDKTAGERDGQSGE